MLLGGVGMQKGVNEGGAVTAMAGAMTTGQFTVDGSVGCQGVGVTGCRVWCRVGVRVVSGWYWGGVGVVSGWCWGGVLVGEGGEVLVGEGVGVLAERVVGF